MRANSTVVPNPLSCKDVHLVQFVQNQIQFLFTGRQSATINGSYTSPASYTSPMILPSSWHPKTSMDQIRSNVYYVTEKYDGVRYFLILCRFGNRNLACMVNRRGTIYPVAVVCASEYFQRGGSLFEGELVFNMSTHKQEYYVFDVIALHGIHVHEIENGHLFSHRMQWVREIFGNIPYHQHVVNQSTTWKTFVEQSFQTKSEWINKIITLGNHFSLQMFPKLFYLLETFDPEFMKHKDIANDGYVFTPDYCPIGPPSEEGQPRIWKWKPHLTIDVALKRDDPTLFLIYKRRLEPLYFVRIRGELVKCRWENRPDETGKFELSDSSATDRQIVECLLDYNELQREIVFVPTRLRHDKHFPNSMRTFQQSLPSLLCPTPIDHVFENGSTKLL